MLVMTASQMKRALHPLLLCCLCQLAAGVKVLVSPQEEAIAQLGDTVSLSCWVEGSDYEEELQWSRNRGLINLLEGNRLNQSHLCVQNLTHKDHRVQFTCNLKKNTSISASVKINVLFPPDLSGEENVTVEESREAKLSCSVWANPPVKVSWLRDGAAVDLLKEGYKLNQDSFEARLIIIKPHRDQHQGTYTCVTESSEFGQRTKSIHVTVTEKTMSFPLGAVIAGCVVVLCTAALAVVSRWSQISKCWK
ncbi:transmembrane and immunoglobulin domain-containing protein 1-like [Colossoma macropomum]|uniref:transmembrane and immunoglobulin domain-containing protein 1-like n=1 Tax=Colossoma macropomum TaxID=42526 RepID=UPI001865456E|nr:transmembrane and immunoglobulin domain-containing protein 1-like [Colossoma macropomum]